MEVAERPPSPLTPDGDDVEVANASPSPLTQEVGAAACGGAREESGLFFPHPVVPRPKKRCDKGFTKTRGYGVGKLLGSRIDRTEVSVRLNFLRFSAQES